MSLSVEIISATKLLLKEDVDELVLPSVNGDAGILNQHADYLTQLHEGEVVAEVGNEKKTFQIRSGFAKVGPEGVTVLVEEK